MEGCNHAQNVLFSSQLRVITRYCTCFSSEELENCTYSLDYQQVQVELRCTRALAGADQRRLEASN